MIPVFQDLTVHNNGAGNCFNAAIASILELPLRKVASILPNTKGDWMQQWKLWLADQGFRMVHHSLQEPPKGYSLATVYTERCYPQDHPRRPGLPIAHCCVAFDGIIVHDPYPLPTTTYDLKYFTALVPLTKDQKAYHQSMLVEGRCIHGYRVQCGECCKL